MALESKYPSEIAPNLPIRGFFKNDFIQIKMLIRNRHPVFTDPDNTIRNGLGNGGALFCRQQRLV